MWIVEGGWRGMRRGATGNRDAVKASRRGGIRFLWGRGAVACALLAWGLWSCDYERMKEQESVNTYETRLPEMPAGAIPVEGGLQMVRAAAPETLRNPLPFDKATVSRGEAEYGHFCAMCHGARADGQGTVGQSFYPLPANLRSPEIQRQSDGQLFLVISFGGRRSPPLAHTIAESDRWAIIHYVRSLVRGPEG
jgi:mono/diheme cytochrome c family protein